MPNLDGKQDPIGEQGPIGEQDPIGEQGPIGEQDPIGEQGPIGEQDPIGERGPTGDPDLQLHMILDSFPGIFFFYSYPECRLLMWNKQHETVLGYTAEELKGMHVSEFHSPEMKGPIEVAVAGVMKTGHGAVEDVLITKDGRAIPYYSTATRVDLHGKQYFMGVCTDYTKVHNLVLERQRTEMLLKKSEASRMLTKVFLFSAWTGILAALTMMFISVMWLVWPYEGIKNFNITSESKTAKAGQLYKWQVEYCVGEEVPLPITIDREAELQNHIVRFPIPSVSYTITKQCERFTRAIVLPVDLNLGEYHLHVFTSIKINPFRTLRQEFIGDTFWVVK